MTFRPTPTLVPRLKRLALVIALGLGALPAGAATLGEIYELARAADHAYAAAVATAAAGREKQAQGRAGLLPTATLGASLRDTHEAGGSVPGHRKTSSHPWNLNITQPVYRPANTVGNEQGVLQATLADQQLKLAEQDLMLRVLRGYFDVLQAQDALAAMAAQREAFAQQLAQAKRSFEVGLAPITDLNEAQARHDLGVAQEIGARNDMELKQRVLERIIGRELPPLAPLDPQASVDLLPEAERQDLLARAPQQALQVAASETSQQVAQLEVQRQRSGHLPTLDLVLSHNEYAANKFVSPGNLRQSSAGLEVQVPLYQGGAVDSRVREAAANLERARQELLNARAQARLDARQAFLGVQSGTALHTALRQALTSGETQVKSTQRGFEVGVRTRVDVLNAQQQLFATRKDLAAARYQTLVAALQLKAAAGALSDTDLRGLDSLLLRP